MRIFLLALISLYPAIGRTTGVFSPIKTLLIKFCSASILSATIGCSEMFEPALLLRLGFITPTEIGDFFKLRV
jgi:hypothetical protein